MWVSGVAWQALIAPWILCLGRACRMYIAYLRDVVIVFCACMHKASKYLRSWRRPFQLTAHLGFTVPPPVLDQDNLVLLLNLHFQVTDKGFLSLGSLIGAVAHACTCALCAAAASLFMLCCRRRSAISSRFSDPLFHSSTTKPGTSRSPRFFFGATMRRSRAFAASRRSSWDRM